MSTLTPEGRRLVQDLARRHGFGEEAVTRMLAAVAAGNGRMAQFDHPEFGGSGQWMSGGMLMLGDMFNQSLKGRVEGLCSDLSEALPSIGSPAGPTQSQSQGGGAERLPDSPLFTPSPKSAWWPGELGTPSATGSQNSMRYAYFADACRLAVEFDGEVRVHDTLDHRIGGFSQQQGRGGEISMTSQHGRIDLESLPVVARERQDPSAPSRRADPPPAVPTEPEPSTSPRAESEGSTDPAASPGADREDPLQLIERLGQLRERGLLTDEEFATKKQELLSRL